MTKEKSALILKYGRTALGIAGLILTPALSHLLFEDVTGNLPEIPFSMALLNICWIGVLYLAAFLVSGRSRISIPLISLLLLALSIGEAFVMEFRSRPIMLWDVLAISTAVSVTKNYRFDLSPEMIRAIGLVVFLNLVLFLCPVRLKGKKLHLTAAGAGTAVIAGFVLFFYAWIVPVKDLCLNMWDVSSTYGSLGYMLSTAISVRYLKAEKPQGYSLAEIQKIYEQIKAEGANQETGKDQPVSPVNVICIMNESLSDLSVVGEFETNQPYFPFISSLRENTVRGNLCMPVFGAMTSNSEFEFLTGDSMALLPAGTSAYQFQVKPGMKTLVSTMEDQGYRTVAVHPYPRENWNRNYVYESMGFDEFLDENAFEGAQILRAYVDDQGDYEKLVQLVEEKDDPEEKLFIFNVTMQNHGGYETQYENFDQQVWLTGELEGKYPQTDQYLSLMLESDQAFHWLIEYFQNCDEPTMIVLFGDHQPAVEDEFFDEIYGESSDLVHTRDRLMWYKTPFLIWTNYENEAEDLGDLGAIYLGSLMLQEAGLEMTPYNSFLLEMKEELPVIHMLGGYDQEGNYYSWEQLEGENNPYHSRVEDYEDLVYNHLFDSSVYRPMFSLWESPEK